MLPHPRSRPCSVIPSSAQYGSNRPKPQADGVRIHSFAKKHMIKTNSSVCTHTHPLSLTKFPYREWIHSGSPKLEEIHPALSVSVSYSRVCLIETGGKGESEYFCGAGPQFSSFQQQHPTTPLPRDSSLAQYAGLEGFLQRENSPFFVS